MDKAIIQLIFTNEYKWLLKSSYNMKWKQNFKQNNTHKLFKSEQQ